MRDESRHDQLLDELRQLLDVVAGKAEDYLGNCDQDAEPGSGTACGWCPLCAAVARLRGHRPELNDQLLGIVRSLRQMLADPRPAEEPEESEEDVPAPSKVRRIAVRRVTGPVLADGEAASRC
ncbi:hypothetical protein SAMN05216215_1009212 [Saccharopolyspora shandongensis]|uniref:Uncharacterized protein n=1 Tax=Saccharopolyspora shandongensis TaxID=418495 RepID=A0A1H3APC6_9PSEU|nr:hypothetical protein [Saccharopolyspora shandongensis]SDX31557.1 hypothetical protein SAMN05216215_1009212 [Saccharopolyspora shandongensis]